MWQFLSMEYVGLVFLAGLGSHEAVSSGARSKSSQQWKHSQQCCHPWTNAIDLCYRLCGVRLWHQQGKH